jgi:hypothetical protein
LLCEILVKRAQSRWKRIDQEIGNVQKAKDNKCLQRNDDYERRTDPLLFSQRILSSNNGTFNKNHQIPQRASADNLARPPGTFYLSAL